jgi:serine/threonine protein kinase
MPQMTLESLAEDIQGSNEDKEGFLRFIRRILRWEPEERPTAKELIFDPWLIDGLGFTDEQIKTIWSTGLKRREIKVRRCCF